MSDAKWYDGIIDEVKTQGDLLAKDWIKNLAAANAPKPASAPPPESTLAPDIRATIDQNKNVLYIVIAIAAVGMAFLFFGGKKK